MNTITIKKLILIPAIVCTFLFLLFIVINQTNIKEQETLACKEPATFNYLLMCYEKGFYDKREYLVLDKTISFADSGDVKAQSFVDSFVKSNNINTNHISVAVADKYTMMCAKNKNNTCIEKILMRNYQRIDNDLNEFYIIYYMSLNKDKFEDIEKFPYTKYLSKNNIPQNQTVFCQVYKICKN